MEDIEMTESFDLPAMLAQLQPEEGNRLFVYDDATGKPIGPGCHVIGHPTIGTGRALDTHGISDAERQYLLTNDVGRVAGELDRDLPWWRTLDPVRQRVLLDMAFEMGTAGLLAFHNTLQLVQLQRWDDAAEAMLSSRWAGEVGARAYALAAMMKIGQAPTA
jgi:lysozyme